MTYARKILQDRTMCRFQNASQQPITQDGIPQANNASDSISIVLCNRNLGSNTDRANRISGCWNSRGSLARPRPAVFVLAITFGFCLGRLDGNHCCLRWIARRLGALRCCIKGWQAALMDDAVSPIVGVKR